jgi:anti-anti-sigma regulatory factor
MEFTIAKENGKVPVTIVQPHGKLDAATYTGLIDRVRKLMMEGAGDFVIDLGDVPFISSAGLMAVQSVALMLRGERPPDSKAEWSAAKSTDRNRAGGMQKHVKLLNLQPDVKETFDKAGFLQFFELFTDLQEAVRSF